VKLPSPFLNLLGGLWDAYFDTQFRAYGKLRVCNAVQAMIEFLVDNSFKNACASEVVKREDDWKMLDNYCDVIMPQFRNEAERLKHHLSQLSLWRSSRVRPSYTQKPSRFLGNKALRGARCCRGDVAYFCVSRIPNKLFNTLIGIPCQCHCFTGPYISDLYVGCTMETCDDHKFCDNCELTIMPY
jgi:hypothetical protein